VDISNFAGDVVIIRLFSIFDDLIFVNLYCFLLTFDPFVKIYQHRIGMNRNTHIFIYRIITKEKHHYKSLIIGDKHGT